MNIGEQLKNLRQQNNYTQEQLADLMNVSYQTVSKWERGIVEPDLQTIIRLSTLYRVGIEVILGLTRPQRNERYDELDLKLSELEKSEQNYERAWDILRDEILAHPDDHTLYLRLMNLTGFRHLCTPERVEYLIMLMCWLERTCHDNDRLWNAYRFMVRICADCGGPRYMEKAREYYNKLPPMRDVREAHARFVLSGEELAHQHRETLFLATDIADTALRLMLPEDATPEQHLATYQRSVALRRAALGEGYAGVYEVSLINSLRNVIYAALTAKQHAVADEAWHELVAIVERQMQQRLAPEEVAWSESVNQAPDKRYPAPEVLTLPTLTKMLENDTFAPYHAQLAPLLERYREVFMV